MGTIKTTNIEPIADNGTVTLGSSGDTFTVPSGVTVAGAMASTPAFSAYLGSDQSVTDNTATKVNFDTEFFDTDGAYDTSNYRFTVPTGGAGKYQIYAQARLNGGDNNLLLSNIVIRKNGTATYELSGYYGDTNDINASPSNISAIIDLAESDYLEIYVKINTTSGSAGSVDKLSYALYQSYWYGYKLIGA